MNNRTRYNDTLFVAAILGVFAIVGNIENGNYVMAFVACIPTGVLAFLYHRARNKGETL